MTRLTIIVAALALSACATTPPAVHIQTVTVDRPVPVTCVKRGSIPAEPAPTGIIPPDARNAADLLGSKLLEVRGWGHKLFALLTACTED